MTYKKNWMADELKVMQNRIIKLMGLTSKEILIHRLQNLNLAFQQTIVEATTMPTDCLKQITSATDVSLSEPVFAMRNDKLCGFVMNEGRTEYDLQKWILRIGGTLGSTGYYPTMKECMENGERAGYIFFVAE